jgi:retinol dehydrogenase 12
VNFEIVLLKEKTFPGPFYLTLKVLPLLAENSRVVNVSSEAHRLCTYLDLPKRVGLFEVYGHSKLCLNLFTRKLASLLENKTAVAVDPGNVETNIFRHYPLLSNPILKVLFWPIRFLTVKTPKQGAQSVLYAILSPEITPACYIRYYFERCY